MLHAIGAVSSASWGGPTYPNATSDGNTLDKYTAHCNGCLYNVGEDMTEHNDVSGSNPEIVAQMTQRLTELDKTSWVNKWTGYSSSCIDPGKAMNSLYGGFIGPFCDIGPLPPSPAPPPQPGPFKPTPLSNCTYLPQTWTFPTIQNIVNVTTKEKCCSTCGMDPTCVASVLTCYTHGECNCNLKKWAADAHLEHGTRSGHTTLTCLTGRQNITNG